MFFINKTYQQQNFFAFVYSLFLMLHSLNFFNGTQDSPLLNLEIYKTKINVPLELSVWVWM